MDLIKVVEKAFETGKEYPAFHPGDTITVSYRIKEGNKERVQQYRGVVIRISGEGRKKRFTLALNVFSLWTRRLSTASKSTSMVRCVAQNCIIFVA